MSSDKKKRGRSSSMVRDDVEMVKTEEVGREEEHFEGNEDSEMDEFEDPFEDEFEQEEEIVHEPKNKRTGFGEDEDDDEWEDVDEDAGEEEEEEEEENQEKSVWNPSSRPLGEGEELEWSSESYQLFHILRSELPCLSFDILLDKLGYQRSKYPQTMYFVAGSQRVDPVGSKIFVMKASQLMKTQYDSESDDDELDDDDEDEEPEEKKGEKEKKVDPEKEARKKRREEDDENADDEPELEHYSFSHPGTVNRIRSMGQCPWVVSAWSEQGFVTIYDVNPYMKLLENNQTALPAASLAHLHPGELCRWNSPGKIEGYALDWSPLKPGLMVSGDCSKNIFVWEPNDGLNSWTVRNKPYSSHTSSVEDLQWSPSEQTVFASCSVDKTIKIWDTRDGSGRCQLSVVGAKQDINVLSWNPNVAYLLLSGSDDHSFSIWDLRTFTSGQAAAHFNWHKGAITSVEWNPNDDSELAVASDDNSVSVWDMSLERDVEEANNEQDLDVPPQLLFLHHGQTELKEVHWHPQIPGLLATTAANGFNVFKPDITCSAATTTTTTTTK